MKIKLMRKFSHIFLNKIGLGTQQLENLSQEIDSLCAKYGVKLPKISQDSAQKLTKKLDIADYRNAVNMLNLDSSPGEDWTQTKLTDIFLS